MWNRIAIPGAILIGCAMMSAALYLGLQTRAGPAAAPPPAPPVAGPALFARVAADAEKELQTYRQAMSAACLHGSTTPIRLKFQMGFNAHGKEIIRGISLDGDGSPEVVSCLSDRFPPAIVVPAPGVKVSVNASLVLP